MIGPLGGLFSRYWTSNQVYPLATIAHATQLTKEAASYFNKITDPTSTQNLKRFSAMGILGYKPLGEELREGRLNLLWGYAYRSLTTLTSLLRARWAVTD